MCRLECERVEKQIKRLSMGTILMLAVLCIGGMQLLFCRFADPELFDRIVTQVINYSHTAWNHAAEKATEVAEKATELKSLFARSTTPQTDEILAPKAVEELAAGDPEDPAKDLVPTAMVKQQDKDVLTGGNVDMVFYDQSDEVWSTQSYGTDDIGKYGCGPTAMSMVVSSMTVYDVNPAQMAAWAVENGHWAPQSGSYQSIVPGASRSYGLNCTTMTPPSAQELRDILADGGVVVALMGKGHFTDGGHFIVLRGVTSEGDILVADPNSRENSLQTWDAQLVLNELATGRANNTLWRITA